MAVKVVQVNERVWQIHAPFGDGNRLVLLYLIKGSKLAMIDTGTAQHPEEVLRPALKELGFDLPDVSYIFITHGHHDHLGGIGIFKREAPNVQICMHTADRPFSESREYHETYSTEFLRQFGRPDLVPGRITGFARTLNLGNGADRFLVDGDRVDLGSGVEVSVVHLPGHTPGSACYYWESEKVLFTGDGVQGRGSYGGNWPFYNHAADYHRSIDKLLELPIETLCLGHPSHSRLALNTPVKYGPEARQMLEDTAAVARLIEGAVRARVRANPRDSNLDIARGVVSDLLQKIPTLLDSDLGLPSGGAGSLWAEIREARADLARG